MGSTPYGVDKHIERPPEFSPKGCRGLPGHLEPRFQAPDGVANDVGDRMTIIR